MCGIFGIISQNTILTEILNGLSLLEYRGYDSAGVSIISENKIKTLKLAGKVSDLKNLVKAQNGLDTSIAISHTRWATHGEPSEINAHPHSNDIISVVHNGIIENYQELRNELLEEEYIFLSSTDSEVVLHLISKYYKKDNNLLNAVHKTVNRLHGSFALLILCKDANFLVATKKHSSLAIGLKNGSCYISSDAYSFANKTNKVTYLEDMDIALCYTDKVEIFDKNLQTIDRPIKEIDLSLGDYTKGNFQHYMQKEIFEQPFSTKNTIENYFDLNLIEKHNTIDFSKIEHIQIIACGTSLYAGTVAREWLQSIAKVFTSVEIASEFYENHIATSKNTLGIFISQSGETADTLKALRLFKKSGHKTIGIVNSNESSIAQETDLTLPLFAGPEIGVASTKAFTSQLIVLAALALEIAKTKKNLSSINYKNYCNAIKTIPGRIAEILNHNEDFKKLAEILSKSKSIIYTGRGISYAISLEGALKLKELSYIHAEAIASGELKHGPIALIDKDLYIIAVIPNDNLFDKTLSNLEAMASRKGKLICLSTDEGLKKLEKISYKTIAINHEKNNSENVIIPILYSVPLQLIAYHTAIIKGCNVDQPRNLAKSVTVE